MRHRPRLFVTTVVASGLLSAVPIAGAYAATAPPLANAPTVTAPATTAPATTAPATTAPATTAPATTAPTTPAAKAGPSSITAKGAILFDDTTGRSLWSRGANTERPMGSIAKVMSALVVIRAGHLDRTVTVAKKWVDYVTNNDFSSAGLKTGDRLTVRRLLVGALLPSGCDAAYGLADTYGPGTTAFVNTMNATAKALGLKHTRFLTPDGNATSSGREGYSTPSDLIRLARAAMKSTTFRSIVDLRSYSIPANTGHHAYTWKNTNQLLGSYPGAIGIKTGHTDGAGYCLLFAARKGRRTLVGVVLNDTTTDYNARFSDAATLLDWGFGRRRTSLPRMVFAADAPKD